MTPGDNDFPVARGLVSRSSPIKPARSPVFMEPPTLSPSKTVRPQEPPSLSPSKSPRDPMISKPLGGALAALNDVGLKESSGRPAFKLDSFDDDELLSGLAPPSYPAASEGPGVPKGNVSPSTYKSPTGGAPGTIPGGLSGRRAGGGTSASRGLDPLNMLDSFLKADSPVMAPHFMDLGDSHQEVEDDEVGAEAEVHRIAQAPSPTLDQEKQATDAGSRRITGGQRPSVPIPPRGNSTPGEDDMIAGGARSTTTSRRTSREVALGGSMAGGAADTLEAPSDALDVRGGCRRQSAERLEDVENSSWNGTGVGKPLSALGSPGVTSHQVTPGTGNLGRPLDNLDSTQASLSRNDSTDHDKMAPSRASQPRRPPLRFPTTGLDTDDLVLRPISSQVSTLSDAAQVNLLGHPAVGPREVMPKTPTSNAGRATRPPVKYGESWDLDDAMLPDCSTPKDPQEAKTVSGGTSEPPSDSGVWPGPSTPRSQVRQGQAPIFQANNEKTKDTHGPVSLPPQDDPEPSSPSPGLSPYLPSFLTAGSRPISSRRLQSTTGTGASTPRSPSPQPSTNKVPVDITIDAPKCRPVSPLSPRDPGPTLRDPLKDKEEEEKLRTAAALAAALERKSLWANAEVSKKEDPGGAASNSLVNTPRRNNTGEASMLDASPLAGSPSSPHPNLIETRGRSVKGGKAGSMQQQSIEVAGMRESTDSTLATADALGLSPGPGASSVRGPAPPGHGLLAGRLAKESSSGSTNSMGGGFIDSTISSSSAATRSSKSTSQDKYEQGVKGGVGTLKKGSSNRSRSKSVTQPTEMVPSRALGQVPGATGGFLGGFSTTMADLGIHDEDDDEEDVLGVTLGGDQWPVLPGGNQKGAEPEDNKGVLEKGPPVHTKSIQVPYEPMATSGGNHLLPGLLNAAAAQGPLGVTHTPQLPASVAPTLSVLPSSRLSLTSHTDCMVSASASDTMEEHSGAPQGSTVGPPNLTKGSKQGPWAPQAPALPALGTEVAQLSETQVSPSGPLAAPLKVIAEPVTQARSPTGPEPPAPLALMTAGGAEGLHSALQQTLQLLGALQQQQQQRGPGSPSFQHPASVGGAITELERHLVEERKAHAEERTRLLADFGARLAAAEAAGCVRAMTNQQAVEERMKSQEAALAEEKVRLQQQKVSIEMLESLADKITQASTSATLREERATQALERQLQDREARLIGREKLMEEREKRVTAREKDLDMVKSEVHQLVVTMEGTTAQDKEELARQQVRLGREAARIEALQGALLSDREEMKLQLALERQMLEEARATRLKEREAFISEMDAGRRQLVKEQGEVQAALSKARSELQVLTRQLVEDESRAERAAHQSKQEEGHLEELRANTRVEIVKMEEFKKQLEAERLALNSEKAEHAAASLDLQHHLLQLHHTSDQLRLIHEELHQREGVLQQEDQRVRSQRLKLQQELQLIEEAKVALDQERVQVAAERKQLADEKVALSRARDEARQAALELGHAVTMYRSQGVPLVVEIRETADIAVLRTLQNEPQVKASTKPGGGRSSSKKSDSRRNFKKLLKAAGLDYEEVLGGKTPQWSYLSEQRAFIQSVQLGVAMDQSHAAPLSCFLPNPTCSFMPVVGHHPQQNFDTEGQDQWGRRRPPPSAPPQARQFTGAQHYPIPDPSAILPLPHPSCHDALAPDLHEAAITCISSDGAESNGDDGLEVSSSLTQITTLTNTTSSSSRSDSRRGRHGQLGPDLTGFLLQGSLPMAEELPPMDDLADRASGRPLSLALHSPAIDSLSSTDDEGM